MKRFLLVLISFNLFMPTSEALMGGEKASGDPKVVALIHWNENAVQGCSGALIAPRIVLTAAHCMSRMPLSGKWEPDNKTFLPVSGPLSEKTPMWVAAPGIDVGHNGTKNKAKVIAQYGPDYYEDSFVQEGGANNHGSLYDFGVLVLDKPLSSETFRISTMEETIQLIKNGYEATALGYGYSNYGGYLDPSPMKSKTNIRSNFIWQGAEKNGILQTKPYYKLGMIIQTDFPDNIYHGGGDSGSPLWVRINNEWVYVGALSGASGPVANLPKNDPIWNDQFWLKNAGGQYYSAWSFQYLIDDANKFLSNEIIKENQEIQSKAAAELKAKQEAEAKAAELKAKQEELIVKQDSEIRVVASKKTTITCLKGKLIRKVTAIKPTCPKGYSRR